MQGTQRSTPIKGSPAAATDRADHLRMEAELVLKAWRQRADTEERDALWAASCWAGALLEALREKGLGRAESAYREMIDRLRHAKAAGIIPLKRRPS